MRRTKVDTTLWTRIIETGAAKRGLDLGDMDAIRVMALMDDVAREWVHYDPDASPARLNFYSWYVTTSERTIRKFARELAGR